MKKILSEKTAIWTGVALTLLAVLIALAEYNKPSDIDNLIVALSENPSLSEHALAIKTMDIAKTKKPSKSSNIVDNSPSNNLLSSCIMLAAKNYDIPPEILVAIYRINSKKFKNNLLARDKISRMGIPKNSIDELSIKWSLAKEETINLIVENQCTMVNVTGWLISKNHTIDKSYRDSIQLYNAGTAKSNSNFYDEVIKKLEDLDLLQN